jgi:hypothetical protein
MTDETPLEPVASRPGRLPDAGRETEAASDQLDAARKSLDVLPFTQDAFLDALASERITREQIDRHSQAIYLAKYLGEIGAATIVVEYEYTDADYLDDVASYYVRSHEDYPRRCTRLHFFGESFDETRFRRELIYPSTVAVVVDGVTTQRPFLQASYCGFVVVRPLPLAIIGRTVLVTYKQHARRRYPGIRHYAVHLFGIELSVESLAYQQQDTVLAACATVALWSAFQKAATLFHTVSPTPAEITRAANSTVFSTRPLPSRGLTVQQMTRAIREVGLEPEVISCRPEVPVVSLICGYLELGLPVILSLDIEKDGHAVTVVGYSLKEAPRREVEDEASRGFIPRIGMRVDQLYVHDDNVGPFAKIRVVPRFPVTTEAPEGPAANADDESEATRAADTVTVPSPPRHAAEGAAPTAGSADVSVTRADVREIADQAVEAGLRRLIPELPLVYFEGSSPKKGGPSASIRLEPKFIIVPVYHKIRLTFMDLQHWLGQVTALADFAEPDLFKLGEWDTRLTTVNSFKADVRRLPLPEPERERLLLARLPRFIWRAVLCTSGTPRMELVFDATGMQRSLPLLHVIYYDAAFRASFKLWLNDPEVATPLMSPELVRSLQAQTP